jgi:hypothetical protein
MARLIVCLAVGGFVLLLVATITLVVLNWSGKTLAPVLSIALVGVATVLVTVLATLKESTTESAFVTSVVIDVDQGAPVFLILSPENPKLTSRLSELASLGRPVVNQDGKTVATIPKPENENERFRFCGELLQYQMLKVIRKLQRGSWQAGMRFGVANASLTNSVKTDDSVDYPGEKLTSLISQNRFSDSDMERFSWKNTQLPLPQKTELSFGYQTPSSGPEQHTILIRRPMFFEITLKIEPLLSTPGVLPPGLGLPPDKAAQCETYQFKISMLSKFERLTAGNSLTEQYKDWTSRLFSGIQEQMGD